MKHYPKGPRQVFTMRSALGEADSSDAVYVADLHADARDQWVADRAAEITVAWIRQGISREEPVLVGVDAVLVARAIWDAAHDHGDKP